MTCEKEINQAISGYRNNADPENLYPNWRELFAKHNLSILGVVGDLTVPDGTTWLAPIGAEYKPRAITHPAIVKRRDDGSYIVKCTGFLGKEA